jgi:hypothetical protein
MRVLAIRAIVDQAQVTMSRTRAATLLAIFAVLPAAGAGVADRSVGIGVLTFLAITVGGWGMAWAMNHSRTRSS